MSAIKSSSDTVIIFHFFNNKDANFRHALSYLENFRLNQAQKTGFDVYSHLKREDYSNR